MQKIFLFVFFLVLCGCAKKPAAQHSIDKLPFDDCQESTLFCDDDLDDLPENPHPEDTSEEK